MPKRWCILLLMCFQERDHMECTHWHSWKGNAAGVSKTVVRCAQYGQNFTWAKVLAELATVLWQSNRHSKHTLFHFFPQTAWPHWSGSYGNSSGRGCSIEVVSGAFGIFPTNFRAKCLLWHVHVHFDCAGSHKTLAAGCGSGIFPTNFRTKCFLRHVHVHFDCAGSHKTLAAGYGSGIFPVNFRAKCFLWHVHVHFDCAGSHKMLAAGYGSGISLVIIGRSWLVRLSGPLVCGCCVCLRSFLSCCTCLCISEIALSLELPWPHAANLTPTSTTARKCGPHVWSGYIV